MERQTAKKSQIDLQNQCKANQNTKRIFCRILNGYQMQRAIGKILKKDRERVKD